MEKVTFATESSSTSQSEAGAPSSISQRPSGPDGRTPKVSGARGAVTWCHPGRIPAGSVDSTVVRKAARIGLLPGP